MLGRVLASSLLLASLCAQRATAAPIKFDLDGDGAPEQVSIAKDGAVSFTTAAGATLATVPGVGNISDREATIHIEMRDRALLRYQRAPGVSRCDGQDRLFVEKFVLEARVFERATAPMLSGRRIAALPSAKNARSEHVFRAAAASIDRDAGGRADHLAPPRELEDDQAATHWSAGEGDVARGQWVTFRSQLGAVPLREITLSFSDKSAPERVLLMTSARPEDRLEVDIPRRARTVTIPLASLPATDCLSLVVSIPASLAATEIAEVRISSTLDDLAALPALIARIAQGDEAAAQLVRSQGAPAAAALAAQYESAKEPARRFLLRALVRFDDEGSARVLARALETAPPEESALLVEGLMQRKLAGLIAAWPLLVDSKQTDRARQAALAVIARADAKLSLSYSAQLLALLGTSPALDPGIEAFFTALLKRGAITKPVLARSIEDELDRGDAASGRVSRLRLLAIVGGATPARVIAWMDRYPDVATQLFSLRALAQSPSPESQARIAERAARATQDIVRAEAMRLVAQVTPSALDDRDPGVRAIATARALTEGPPGLSDAAIAHLEHDAWPLVRDAAVAALETHCGALSPQARGRVRARLERGAERHEPTRRKLTAIIGACGTDEAVPLLTRMVLDRGESFSLRATAVTALARLPRRDAAPLVRALTDATDAVMRDEQAVGLALASLRALATTGDASESTLTAIGIALHDMAWPALRAASYDALGELCPKEAVNAFARGPEDPDAQVRSAALRARARCERR